MKWIDPGSHVFIIVTVMLFIVAIICFATETTSNGIICLVLGVIGVKIIIKEKKNKK